MNTILLTDCPILTGVPYDTIRKWVQRGIIKAVKIDGKWRLNPATLKKIKRLHQDKAVKMPSIPYEDALTSWKEAMRSGYGYKKPLLPRSVQTNLSAMGYYWRWLKQKPSIEIINVDNLELAFSRVGMNAETCHYSMKIQAFKAVKSFLKHLAKRGFKTEQDVEALSKARPYRVVPAKRVKITKDQLHQLIKHNHYSMREGRNDYQRARMYLLLMLTGYSGLRIRECLELPVKAIEFEQNRIKVLGKGMKLRYAPLPKEVAQVAKSWLKHEHQGDRLLLEGMTYNACSQAIQRLSKSSGIDICWHGLRRTAATWWVNEGMPLPQAKSLLGHSDIQTTMLYVESDSTDAVNWFH
ncbi:MAG: tyrosine-type recombinase/integrase [Vampirovibrionales bacterium]|jgi:site-specific recombinase XerD|nr:tyrosine-type recombinase/integrase [Vampirovibrionales bacterium]